MKWHNFRFKDLKVTFHLLEDKQYLWQRVYGVQIGEWFIGAVKGRELWVVSHHK